MSASSLRSSTPLGQQQVKGVEPGKTVLFSYWRSSCSWRVRIALNFKQIPYEYRAVNLLQKEQKEGDYTDMNPSKLVPTLVMDNHVLTQSVAILEYLEERRPESWRLLPIEADKRAATRALVAIITSDIQPIQNLRVLQMVGEEKKAEWGKHWISVGFDALEKALSETSGTYCVGDSVTLADVCLVPQVYNARRFKVDLSQYPIISRIEEELSKMEPFIRAHPDNQPDKPSE